MLCDRFPRMSLSPAPAVVSGLLIAKTLAEGWPLLTVVATMRGMDTKNSDKAQALRDYAKERNLRVHSRRARRNR